MAFAEYLQLARKVTLQPLASTPANIIQLTLESGTPYRHYIAWVSVAGAGTINVDVQPQFAGVSDGSVVNFAAAGAQKVFMVPVEEIRPATRGLHKHPDDSSPPNSLKSELLITNKGLAKVEVNIFMLAAAAPGGA